MPEETAFSVLVKIMYAYGHRNLFKANFQDLHLMFFQLEKLMEARVPIMADVGNSVDFTWNLGNLIDRALRFNLLISTNVGILS